MFTKEVRKKTRRREHESNPSISKMMNRRCNFFISASADYYHDYSNRTTVGSAAPHHSRERVRAWLVVT